MEIAEQAMDAFNRRDVEGFFALAVADFEWFPALPSTVEGDCYQAATALKSTWGEIDDTWEEFRVIAEEYRDLGGRVLLLGRMEGRGRGSGFQVESPLGAVWDFRDGRISRARVYLDHGNALRAAGLSGVDVSCPVSAVRPRSANARSEVGLNSPRGARSS